MDEYIFKPVKKEGKASSVEEINHFVYQTAPHLQEGGSKIDELIENLIKKCSDLTVEQRWNTLEKMKQERQKRIKKFSRPPIDLRNELELIERILDKWHSGGEV